MIFQEPLIAEPEAFVQILAITFGLSIFSQIFQWFTRTGMTGQSDIQERSQALQTEMKLAKNDPERMYELQREQAEVLKTISKKQMVPMLIRSVIFIGIFGLISRIYNKYDSIIFGLDWYLVYFIFSMVFSLILSYFRKMLRRKLYPDEEHAQTDKIRATSSNLIYNKNSQPLPKPSPKATPMANSTPSWKKQVNSSSSNWKNRLDEN